MVLFDCSRGEEQISTTPRRRRSKPIRRHRPPSSSSLLPPRRKTYRTYGLPNANQILLAIVILGMLCYQLIHPDWIQFDEIDARAGLIGMQMTGENDTSVSIPWRDYCTEANYTFISTNTIPPDEPQIDPWEVEAMCDSPTIEIVRALTITCIALTFFSIVIGLYLHFGTPTHRQMVWLGIIPGLSLFSCAVVGTIALEQWQQKFAHLNVGACLGVAIASVVIAYITSISMLIRWRWPGICMVPSEQQAFEARTYQPRETVPPPPPSGGELHENSEPNGGSFFQFV